MIGESGGVTTLVYQEQVSRENQIQRDQSVNRETEDNSNRQVSADVTSFSSAALELSRTAVSAVETTPVVEPDSQAQETGFQPADQQEGSSPAQYLDVRV
jgi:hypothetical protein